jgi:hypothetical protein
MHWRSELFAATGESDATTVQVMTLHRAKGLQFDAVILPALDVETGGSGQPVLRWKVRQHDGASSLILAPLARKGRHRTPHPIRSTSGSARSTRPRKSPSLADCSTSAPPAPGNGCISPP